MSALLPVRAAADRLGVSYSTLKQWIYDGAVRTTRTKGGHHRLAEAEVQRLLLSGTAAGAAPSGKTAARGKVAMKGSRAARLAPPAKSGVLTVVFHQIRATIRVLLLVNQIPLFQRQK